MAFANGLGLSSSLQKSTTFCPSVNATAATRPMLPGSSSLPDTNGTTTADTNNSPLLINEIQVGNIDAFMDPSLNYGGWIELYNTGSTVINLSYYYISDDPENLKKFRFPTTIGTVPAGGFKTIWFDHNSADGSYSTNANKQVRFKMDADGGTLYISDSSGNLIITQDFPAAISRCSFARTTDGGSTWRWCSTPTPEAKNAGSTFADQQLDVPEISINSGIIRTATTVKVTAPEGVTIKYTSDGSVPTLTNGFTVPPTGIISVNKTLTFRFRAFKDGYLPSAVITRSYLFPDKNYTLPIVSVVTDQKHLYDSKTGVYVVGDGTYGETGRGQNTKTNKNRDWERPVNFEYITPDGQCRFNQEVTFYISGGWSRHSNPTSFKLKAEKRYEGRNSLDYTFFDNKPFIKNKCLVMRNGGNDNWSRTKDGVIQHIIYTSGMYLDCQSFNPCHVIINGKYLGMLNMREPSNKFFAYANYGIDTDFVDAFELSPDFGGQVHKAGTTVAWTNLLSLASKASDDATYKQIVDQYLDIDEYINYMAAECWIGSWDWLTNNNNTKWFRSTDNGRFHFVMFDMDSGFDNNNMLGSLKGSASNNVTMLFNRLAKNADFKRQFITSYCIVAGSVFTKERAKASADYIGNLTSSALSLEGHDPWGSCNEVVSKVGDSNARNARMNALRNYFSLATGMTVKINSNIDEAELSINDMPVPTGKFNGMLFAPVTLKASAPAGYNFVGWRHGSYSSTPLITKGAVWYYYDKGSLDGQDWKTGTVNWKTGAAPLGYGSQSFKTTISYGGNSNNKYPTYYFRRNVNLGSAPDNDESITLNFVADDGFIIYVNGKEAGRHLMPSGTVNYNTYATTYSSGNPDTGSLDLDPTLFQKGNNIIAVEVHNNSASSSDIYWDAEILLQKNSGDITTSDRELTLTSNQNGAFTAVFEPLPEECLIAAGSTPVVINEVSAGNSVFVNDYFKKNDWVELYNTTSQPVDVAGMYLSDNPSNPHKYQISADGNEVSTTIPAHGHLIIWADKLDPMFQLHSTFKLGNNDGECVILTAADDSWNSRLDYIAHRGDESVGRYPDGGKTIYKMSLPTIGQRNTMTTYAEWLEGTDENFDIDAYIAGVDIPAGTDASVVSTEYYTIDGIRLDHPQRGLNIIRLPNGTVKKVLIK